jgi:hypothetical protein
MRKISILLLAVVALLAFTASAFALHGVKEMLDYTPSVVKAKTAQVELSGHIRIRGNIQDNNSDFEDTDDGVADDDSAGYDQRVRLMTKATVSPNTQGVFELELSDTRDTDVRLGSDGYAWGSQQAGGGVYNLAGNSKMGNMAVRQAYVAHQTTALGPLAGFKAGHMLIALGNGSYYNHTKGGDDTLLFWVQPQDGTEIAFAIIKGDENGDADDIDIYALTLDTKAGDIGLSADVSYLNDNSMPVAVDAGLNLWNIGIRASADLQGVGINAGCDFQTGEIEEVLGTSDDVDLSGYQCQAGASVKVGDASVHAKFAYGSGDDIDSDDDMEMFITSISSGGNVGTFVYDNSAVTASMVGNTTGLSNTWYLNAGATTNISPDLKVNAEIFYLQASEEVSDIDGFDETDIGVEVDGKITYQIDTSLAWYLEAGILFAGDFNRVHMATLDPDGDPDNAWKIRHGIVFSF